MKDHHPLLVEAGVPGARRRAKSGPLPDSAKLRGEETAVCLRHVPGQGQAIRRDPVQCV